MIRILLPLILVLHFGGGCLPPGKSSVDVVKPDDSFFLSKSLDLTETLNLTYIDDQTLVSFDFSSNKLTRYQKAINKYILISAKELDISSSFQSFCKISDTSYLLVSTTNEHFRLDSSGKTKQLSMGVSKQYLKKDFLNCSLHYHPMVTFNGSIFSTYYYQDLEQYVDYFKEPAISKYIITNDSIAESASYFRKPVEIANFRQPFPKFCFDGEHIFLLYPCLNNIYTLNCKSGKMSEIQINNPDYSRPAEYNFSKKNDNDYNSYDTKYTLNNFDYKSIFYNAKTEHIILFYTSPYYSNKFTSTLNAIILDKELNTLKRITFSGREYFDTENFLTIPDKGIAMPIYTNNKVKNEKDILYHIYNL